MADYSRLSVYNNALLHCKERALVSLTDNIEARYLLDTVWNSGGVDACLEAAQWEFAMRAVQIDYDPTIAPSWGYKHGFTKPTDWLLTSSLCQDETLSTPLNLYTDEAGVWYTDLTRIWVRYVSNDAAYGANSAKWPPSFFDFVCIHFADKIVGKLTSSKELVDDLEKKRKHLLMEAKNRCAMAGPVQFAAQGYWSRARQGRQARRDRGNPGSLYG